MADLEAVLGEVLMQAAMIDGAAGFEPDGWGVDRHGWLEYVLSRVDGRLARYAGLSVTIDEDGAWEENGLPVTVWAGADDGVGFVRYVITEAPFSPSHPADAERWFALAVSRAESITEAELSPRAVLAARQRPLQ